MSLQDDRSLKELRAEFGKSRFLAMPIAGAIAWLAAGVFGAILATDFARSMALFFCMPAVFPIAFVVSKFIGEDVIATERRNELDGLFMSGILMANLVWGIAIPFWLVEQSSLPLAGGILAGLMWIPFSWIIQHWVGIFHAVARTVLVTAAWWLFPDLRFVLIPGIIVCIYLISIIALIKRQPDSAG